MYTDTVSPRAVQTTPPTADVVIVGGGIAGVSLAAELGSRMRVVVLEAESALFRHTSSRSAQQVQPNHGPPPIRQLTATTLQLIREIETELGSPILSSRPLWWIALDGAPIAGMADELPGARTAPPAEVQAAVPALRPGIVRGAAVDDDANEVKVAALLEHYARRAAAHGVTFVTGARVTSITRTGSGSRLDTSAGTITAPLVVDAAGAWADQVAHLAGAETRGLVPTRRSVILAAPTGTPVDPSWPMVVDLGESVYFRPRGTEVLASALEDEPSVAEDARPRDEVIDLILARVNALTTYELVAANEAWTGLRTLSPDALPVVGFDAQVDGFYWLAGQGGFGIQTSAAIARLAAAEITGDDVLATEDRQAFAAFRPERF